MKANTFNICPTCIHRDTCVLTTQKSQVWSCSEYDESSTKVNQINIKKNAQPEMAMA
ncbi:hypothetical protein ACFO5T_05790 [Dokdonia genika]|uniref:Uncharacterized protein n=1 Tax=Dokdonia genika TaxID=308113 RepID=A0ABV9L7A5_9FLAO